MFADGDLRSERRSKLHEYFIRHNDSRPERARHCWRPNSNKNTKLLVQYNSIKSSQYSARILSDS